MKFPITLLPAIILLFSCSSAPEAHEPPADTSKVETRGVSSPVNTVQVNELNQKNNAIVGWDSVATYTYKLQEQLENNTRPVSCKGRVQDI